MFYKFNGFYCILTDLFTCHLYFYYFGTLIESDNQILKINPDEKNTTFSYYAFARLSTHYA